MRSRPSSKVTLAFAILLVATAAATTEAHEVGLSRGDYELRGKVLQARVVFARKDFITLVAGLDRDHDGLLTEAELTAGRDSIQGAMVGRVKVTADGRPCEGTLERTALEDQDGASITASYACAARPKKITVTLGFFGDLAFGHRHLARLVAGSAAADAILSQRTDSLSLDVPVEAAVPEATGPTDTQGESHDGLFTTWRVAAFTLALSSLAGRAKSREPEEVHPRALRALIALACYVAAAGVGHLLVARAIFVPSPFALAVATSVSLIYAGLEASRGEPAERRSFDAGPWQLLVPFGVVHGMAYVASVAPWMGALIVGALAAFALSRLPRRLTSVGGLLVLVAGAVDLAIKLRS